MIFWFQNFAFKCNLHRYNLDAVVEAGYCVSPESFDVIIDYFFSFHSASPPMFMAPRATKSKEDVVRGELRPAVIAAFATAVIYFKEMLLAGESSSVIVKLKHAVVAGGVTTMDGAESTLEKWGDAMRAKFQLANFHLTSKDTGTSSCGAASGTTMPPAGRRFVRPTWGRRPIVCSTWAGRGTRSSAARRPPR